MDPSPSEPQWLVNKFYNQGEDAFRLLNWAIGLHVGVARPQGKASQYISPVRDAATDYRSASGRGYSEC